MPSSNDGYWCTRRCRSLAVTLLVLGFAASSVFGTVFVATPLPQRPSWGRSVLARNSGMPPRPDQSRRVVMRAGERELDTDAVGKYVAAIAVQLLGITTFFMAIDSAVKASGAALPDWAVFALFFGMSLRSRIFSPLDNSRPDISKAAKGESTGGFNDRTMPSWTPPGFFFPIMWILIVAPLRAASSVLIWQQVGHLCDATILTLMLHLCVGDTWNTVNNVERRLGAAVPGVLCVWASALAASFAYFQVEAFAGELLVPTCLWLTVAAALVTDTWRVNNTAGSEPLFPYRGETQTRFWFSTE
mmetsp:Transcript_23582/g.54804  ORF Transcript_23582/g.54804 Transcript_23582/m.54804 type:complete len:302 (+) Transcript_23582:63-968(+)